MIAPASLVRPAGIRLISGGFESAVFSHALTLRREVFVHEQGGPAGGEPDSHDGPALHLLLLLDGVPAAACRLCGAGEPCCRIGRLCVAAVHRRRGLGSAMLRAAEDAALRLGSAKVELAAQQQLTEWYAGRGYAVKGSPFLEAGIRHVLMEKHLRSAGEPDVR